MKIWANGIAIEVEDSQAGHAPDGRPVLLLIMGLGMQLTAWPQEMVQALVDAGYRVIRHDNRDIGLSQAFDELGTPNLALNFMRFKLGLPVSAPYSLRDMAADSLGVLDALGIARAHVVGLSMGGMIAQRVALMDRTRVASLTSIMSSSGASGLPSAKPGAMWALLGKPDGDSHAAIVAHYVRLYRAIGSPGFPTTEGDMLERIGQSIARSFRPRGAMRQMAAVAADTGRAKELERIASPTLVLHGHADPLLPFACGEDTARRIPGAQLVGITGMGHDLAPGVVRRLLDHMLPFLSTGLHA